MKKRYSNLSKQLAIIIALFLLLPKPVGAQVSTPTFSSCPAATGEIVANYSEGEHAIVGISGLKTGSDQVYQITSKDYVQCYCPETSSGSEGIQTNWFAIDSLSREEKNNLITQGWNYIPNGQDWGLDPVPYLAKNLAFSCTKSTPGNSGSDNGGGTSDPSGSNSNNSLGNSSGSSDGQGGEVLGISTLAPTNSPNTKYQILLALTLAISSIAYGFKIQKTPKR